MKSRLPILFTALISLSITRSALAGDVSYAKVVWKGIAANVVYANTASHSIRVTPGLARRGPGSSESFGSMVKRLRPTAAITGTFFCTRSLQPTGDIVIEGKRMHSGSIGTGLCIARNGHVEFRSIKDGRASGWQDCEAVVCGGPTLVRDGKIALAPKSEGFTDPGLFGRKRRAAVGLTANNKLLMVTIEKAVSLTDLAKVMMHLGAADAIDLDGGSSTALSYRGKVVSRPARSLTNVIVVYETPAQYAACRSQLAPNMPRQVVAAATRESAQSVMIPNDPILSALYTRPAKSQAVEVLRWENHEPLIGERDDFQFISAKREPIN